MTAVFKLRSTLLAASITLASTLPCGVVLAQTTTVAGAGLSSATLKDHQDDLEAMIADLGKVQTPDVAKSYEGYLTGQMPKYAAHHKSLHQVALPGFGSLKKLGKATAEQQKLADATDKLNETHYPRLVAEMDRVEKLNPGLKKNFDQLRSLE